MLAVGNVLNEQESEDGMGSRREFQEKRVREANLLRVIKKQQQEKEKSDTS